MYLCLKLNSRLEKKLPSLYFMGLMLILSCMMYKVSYLIPHSSSSWRSPPTLRIWAGPQHPYIQGSTTGPALYIMTLGSKMEQLQVTYLTKRRKHWFTFFLFFLDREKKAPHGFSLHSMFPMEKYALHLS